jgi:hypothetical protein
MCHLRVKGEEGTENLNKVVKVDLRRSKKQEGISQAQI